MQKQPRTMPPASPIVHIVNRRMGGSVAPVLLGWNATLNPPLSDQAVRGKRRRLASGNLRPRAMTYYSILPSNERGSITQKVLVLCRVSGVSYVFNLVLLVSLRFSLMGYVLLCFTTTWKSMLLVTTQAPQFQAPNSRLPIRSSSESDDHVVEPYTGERRDS